MYPVRLNHSYTKPDGTIIYDSEADARRDLLRILREMNGEEKLIDCFDDGIEVNGVPLKLTLTQRVIMQNLKSGKCGRWEMIDSIYDTKKLQKMKNSQSAMRSHVYKLNLKLEAYGLYIEIDSDSYRLKKAQ